MKLVGVDEVRAENDEVWALRYSEHLGAESRGTSRMPELTVFVALNPFVKPPTRPLLVSMSENAEQSSDSKQSEVIYIITTVRLTPTQLKLTLNVHFVNL